MAIREIGPVSLTDDEIATDLFLCCALRESPVLSARERECIGGILLKLDDLLECRALVSRVLADIGIPQQSRRAGLCVGSSRQFWSHAASSR